MNQAVLFVDRVEYIEDAERINFFAQVNGQLITCFYLTKQSKEKAIKDFESKRFDYEDIAESAIEDELYNDQGEIEIEELL